MLKVENASVFYKVVPSPSERGWGEALKLKVDDASVFYKTVPSPSERGWGEALKLKGASVFFL